VSMPNFVQSRNLNT